MRSMYKNKKYNSSLGFKSLTSDITHFLVFFNDKGRLKKLFFLFANG